MGEGTMIGKGWTGRTRGDVAVVGARDDKNLLEDAHPSCLVALFQTYPLDSALRLSAATSLPPPHHQRQV